MKDTSKKEKPIKISGPRRFKRRHKSLEESRRRYEFIVNTSRDFMSLIDAGYRYVAVNSSYCKALGLKREDIIDQTVAEIWGEEIFSKIIKPHLESCFEGLEVNYMHSFIFAALGERVVDVTYYPYKDRRGRITHAVVVSRDVTDEKKHEDELLFLKKAVETMQLGVTISDPFGRIIYTNPAEARMHGYSVRELTGRDVNIFAPVGLRNNGVERDLSGVSSWTRESLNLRNDGSIFPVQIMSDVVKRGDGAPIGIVATCEDITARKRSEMQILTQIRRFGILRQIDGAILSSLDLKTIIGKVLDSIISHLNVHAAAVMIYKPETRSLEHIENRGFRSGPDTGGPLTLGDDLAGRVALESKPVYIPDLVKHSGLPDHIRDEKFCFYYGLPLIVKGQVKGTLEIFHREELKAGDEWIEFVESLSQQTAIAIDNISLFNDLQHSNLELAEAYDRTLDGWVRALDLRDKETEGHSQRVTALTVRLAEIAGFSEQSLAHVRRGALLHDIGKIGIPDYILHKEDRLSEDEWTVMKLHPVYAYEMLSPISFLNQAINIPYCHHEKWDGSGYPRGLKGEETPLEARLFAIIDIWDALTSDRPYRPSWPKDRVIKHIQSLSGSHFDPDVVDMFLRMDL